MAGTGPDLFPRQWIRARNALFLSSHVVLNRHKQESKQRTYLQFTEGNNACLRVTVCSNKLAATILLEQKYIIPTQLHNSYRH